MGFGREVPWPSSSSLFLSQEIGDQAYFFRCSVYWVLEGSREDRYEMTSELSIRLWQLMAFSSHSSWGCSTLMCGLPTMRISLMLTDDSMPWDLFFFSRLIDLCKCFAWFWHWSPVWHVMMGIPVLLGSLGRIKSLWRRDGYEEPVRMLTIQGMYPDLKIGRIMAANESKKMLWKENRWEDKEEHKWMVGQFFSSAV